MNSRGSATQEPTPGKQQKKLLPQRGSPLRDQRALHMGLPLRGRVLFLSVPGVAFVPQATPGYSWRTPPGFRRLAATGSTG